MQDYQTARNKKGNGWEIKFKINIPTHNYRFFLTVTVFETGKSVINVSSYQRDPIAFYREIALPAEIYNQRQ
jgi:hypothetical protein